MKWISILIWLLFWAAMLFSQNTPTANGEFKIAFAAFQQGDYDLAIDHFNRAISLDPNRNYFYYNRGMTYEAKGNHNQAIADFRKSNNLMNTAEASYQAGLIEYRNNDFKAAQTDFENAKVLRDDLGMMNFYLGMVYFKDKNYEEGYKCFLAFGEHNRTNPDAWYYKGYCEAKLGKYEDAVQSLKLATLYQSKDWRYYHKMYEVYTALNDNQDALSNINMVIELGQHKLEYYENRAQLYKAMGDDFRAGEDAKLIELLKEAATSSNQ